MTKEAPKKRRFLMPWMRKRKGRLLWGKEFNTVKRGLDEKQVVSFVNDLKAQYSASLYPLLETTSTGAEQIATSIKMKAQAEAEAEAAAIVTQAKQDAQEIKRTAEAETQKEADDILSVADRKAEITVVEAKQKALLFLLKAREEIERQIREEYKRAYSRLFSSLQDLMSEGQNIEVELKNKRAWLWESKDFELREYEAALLGSSGVAAPPLETSAPAEAIEEKIEPSAQLEEEAIEEKIEPSAQLEEEATEEKIEPSAQLQEEAPVSEPVEAATEELLEERPPEEGPGAEETKFARPKLDSQGLYAGEVELIIASPVELKLVSRLYNYLQTVPELRILYTRGSWDQGTTITIVLDKPLPLISIISKTPGVEVTPELLEKDAVATGKSGSPLRGGEKKAKSIRLVLEEAQPSSSE